MSPVPGSLFRRILFWAHLACGIAAGLLILLMSVTGILLAYERQILDSAAQGNRIEAVSARMDADTLAGIARSSLPEGARFTLAIEADAAQPVVGQAGREASVLLNPYTGAVIDDAAQSTRNFFRVVENWHRWMGGDSRSGRATAMDVANLLFLFIVASGIYLWLPAVWRWRTLRGLMLFQARYVNGKVRDFNWHHVFSFWMLIPLFLIALSGVVISYPWASNLVYKAYGEEAPRRGAQGTGGPGGAPRTESPPDTGAPRVSLEQMLAIASSEVPEWKRISMPVAAPAGNVDVTIELPSEELRPPRRTLTLDADGRVVKLTPPPDASSVSPGQRARTWLRFVHTGEQYGVIGQTLAAIASLAACFLAYTGLALAWRRLVRPLFARAT
jgi:uncharacterized iron-regulated membrane protein